MAFSAILSKVAARHSHVRGIVFCDDEGERIQATILDPTLTPFALDVAGASLAPIAAALSDKGIASHVRAKTGQGSLWMHRIAEGFYLVAVAHADLKDPLLEASLESAADAIRAEL